MLTLHIAKCRQTRAQLRQYKEQNDLSSRRNSMDEKMAKQILGSPDFDLHAEPITNELGILLCIGEILMVEDNDHERD